MKRPGFLQVTGPNLFLGRRVGIVPPVVSSGAAPAWTPADIADLAIFFHFKPGVNCAYASNGGAATGAGDPVGYAAPLFGAPISASNAIALLQPTLQADGLQLDAAGLELLNFSTQFSATDITIYWSMILGAASSIACFATDAVQGSLLGGASDVGIFDNLSNYLSAAASSFNEVIMGRFNMSGAGDYSVIATGEANNSGSTTNFGFDFNQIGGTGAIGAGNDSVDNRFRVLIAINRAIALGSAEDLLIRNWISTNDGAEL